MNKKNVLTSVVVGVALGLAGGLGAQAMLVGTRIEIPGHVQLVDGPTGINNGFMRFTTADGKAVLAEIQADGSYKMHFGATIKFSGDGWTPYAGAPAGFVWVMVGDKWLLMPVYNPPSPDRLIREHGTGR